MADSRRAEVSGRGVGGGRSLKTAAEALAALRFLGSAEEGITAEALAAELGKSTATARYLLNTLCQEGFALRDRQSGLFRLQETPPWGDAWGDAEAPHDVSRVRGRVASLERARVRRRHAEGLRPAALPISPPARSTAHAVGLTGVVRDAAATATRGWLGSASDLPPPPPADPVPPGY